MQIGKLGFQFDQRMIGAGNVPCAAGTGAHAPGRLLQGADDLFVLTHAEIVVGAPDDDFALLALAPQPRAREAPDLPLQIGENPVASLRMQGRHGSFEMSLVIEHAVAPSPENPF